MGQLTEKTSHDVSDDIFQMMSRILDEVRQMVRSFLMHEVKKSDLDERVRNLAAAAFPDPSQHIMQSHYARAATGLLCQILKDNDKVIAEETVPEKNSFLRLGDVLGEDVAGEDIDQDAYLYPLSKVKHVPYYELYIFSMLNLVPDGLL